ncbi:orotidine-5'-phosphate decarboxylase [Salsuginibacillus kocurii]|uniref:orotidine-5'-phosphate decarboxylase n=1 Tax=Salsuginibacillus kocurii TaxID=427078 RepID=UPI00035E6432|nr:orotidine-5'-phosphate decarboxylase [Salsuginibacillus kocurii]
MNTWEEPIIALDYENEEEAKKFLSLLEGSSPRCVKVGMELYYASGPDFLRWLIARGYHVFLDLKLMDIPTTVKKTMRVLASMGVGMVNVHAPGGSTMMKAALEGLEEGTKPGQARPICIAVTQLTSTTEHMMQTEQLIDRSLEEVVVEYAKLTQQAGLDGVVCSANEAELLKQELGNDFLLVTPGIRFKDEEADDQKRVVDPGQAKAKGSDAIVVGRSITQAEDPQHAYENVVQLWRDAQ